MMEIFREAATGITNRYISEWEKSGKKVVGYTCSFMPPEIFHAAGILPYRIRGIETESMEIGDAYYGPFVCTFPKCLLQLAGEGKFRFLSGAVVSTGCDAMRRLDECWRKAGEDFKGTLPEFFHYFDVPHKTDPHALKWFEDEIAKLVSSVESHFNVNITEQKLNEAIRIYNHGRNLLWKLEKLRASKDLIISGEDVFSVAVAGTVMPREIFNEELETLLENLSKKNEKTAKGRIRIMIAGSINDDIELVKLIEDAGSTVVADSICFGIRSETDQVDTKEKPVAAMAKRYLSNSVCPRMFGAYQQRFDFLKEKAERAGVEGIILQNIRFCDLHGSENGLFEKDFEKMGIPCLRLEREYGPLTETGRMKMRIEAFLERIS
ncbi:MAG: 2-hydroxyacyl-CoA dehydratase family protein [Desulfobacterales bacterium]